MDAEEIHSSFNSMNLDDRLLKSISKQGWSCPTPVQSKVIPLVLEGKDIVARAKTGSGKSAAYLIPTIQKIIDNKEIGKGSIQCLVILPSKELCKQAYEHMVLLTSYCSKDVQGLDIGNKTVDSARLLLSKSPNFIFTTPSKLLANVHNEAIAMENFEILVIDEADIMFSYGYEKELNELLNYLPKSYQAVMLSATISDDVTALKKKFLTNPVVLRVDETDLPPEAQLAQYLIKCEPNEKFLLLVSLLKLNLLHGKILLFVNNITRCYKVKLFLEQFAVSSCVLNSELPQNSRLHIVDQFNKGIYDIIITTDEATEAFKDPTVKEGKVSKGASSKTKKEKSDKEYCVSRGIDFQNVENVMNFDFPTNAESYIHRVGRTARGNSTGTALSLVTSENEDVLHSVNAKLSASQTEVEDVLKPYLFKMNEIEGFKYRVNDALRAVTKASIKEARLKEIKTEMMNSSKLKSYFQDNPNDLKVLRHDKTLLPTKCQPHMKNVPEYLVPDTLKPKISRKRRSVRKMPYNISNTKNIPGKKKKKDDDPLKTFKFQRPGKKK